MSDDREIREPRLIAGDSITIYAKGQGLTTIKIIEKGSGLLGSDFGAKTIDEYEVVSVSMLYTNQEDISKYEASDTRNEYEYYLKGLNSER